MHLRDELKITRPLAPGHEMALGILLTREYVGRLFEKALFEGAGITDQQFNVLRILKGGPPEGYLIRDLRTRMIYRFADVPRLVNRLVAQGYVTRCENPADRRGSRIRITQEGLALEARIHAQHDELCNQVAEGLDPAERDTLLTLLERLRNGLRDRLKAVEKG